MRTFLVSLALLLIPLAQTNSVAQGGAAGHHQARPLGRKHDSCRAVTAPPRRAALISPAASYACQGHALFANREESCPRSGTQLGYTDKGLADMVASFDAFGSGTTGKPSTDCRLTRRGLVP